MANELKDLLAQSKELENELNKIIEAARLFQSNLPIIKTGETL